MHSYLLNVISQKVSLTEADIDLCKACFEPVLFPKNGIVEEEVCKRNNAIFDYTSIGLKNFRIIAVYL
jgi:hypothetical protein